MADTQNILKRLTSLDTAPQFDSYSKVSIAVDDDAAISAGDDVGREMTVENPLFGSVEVAEKMLARLRGFQYQPAVARGALTDPALEIGDGVTANGVYFGMYTRDNTFGRLMAADVSAPASEEINHEYKFISAKDRRYNRELGDVRATLLIQADLIEAKVSRQSPEGNTSFGWSLEEDNWTVFNESGPIFRVDESGGTFTGAVVAALGRIGGFEITRDSIQYGMTSIDDTTSNGVYLGLSGLALGGGRFKVTSMGNVTIGDNFRVDSAGNVSANNMTLTGTLMVGGNAITANALRIGAQDAYTNGGTWTTGSGYGFSYNSAIGGESFSTGLRCKYLMVDKGVSAYGTIYANSGIYISGHTARWGQISVGGNVYNILTY